MSTNDSNANQPSELKATDQSIVEIGVDQLETVVGGDGGGLEHKWNSMVRGTRYVNDSVQNAAQNVKDASGIANK